MGLIARGSACSPQLGRAEQAGPVRSRHSVARSRGREGGAGLLCRAAFRPGHRRRTPHRPTRKHRRRCRPPTLTARWRPDPQRLCSHGSPSNHGSRAAHRRATHPPNDDRPGCRDDMSASASHRQFSRVPGRRQGVGHWLRAGRSPIADTQGLGPHAATPTSARPAGVPEQPFITPTPTTDRHCTFGKSPGQPPGGWTSAWSGGCAPSASPRRTARASGGPGRRRHQLRDGRGRATWSARPAGWAWTTCSAGPASTHSARSGRRPRSPRRLGTAGDHRSPRRPARRLGADHGMNSGQLPGRPRPDPS